MIVFMNLGQEGGFDGKEGTVSGVLLGRHPSHGFT